MTYKFGDMIFALIDSKLPATMFMNKIHEKQLPVRLVFSV